MVIPEKEPGGEASVGLTCGTCGHDYSVKVQLPAMPAMGEHIDVPIPQPTCPKCGAKVTDDLSIRIAGEQTGG